MEKVKLKMKKPFKIFVKIVSIILIILLILFIIWTIILDSFRSIGYSKAATINIFKEFKIQVATDNPNNKTLNAAFESDYYKEKNINHYIKIKYHKGKDLVSNINKLISKGYTDREINIILSHGNNDDVKEFAKKDKISYIDEFYSYSFAKLKNYDRYITFMDNEGDDEEDTIIKVNLDLDKENYKDPIKTNDYSKNVLANKHHYLGSKYVPKLVSVPSKYLLDKSEKVKGTSEAVNAAINMINAASKDGLNLRINSGYRSYKDQEETYNYYKDLYGESYCRKYVILPGYSEHQTGYAFDFGSLSSKIFEDSKEYDWMVKNAYKYGFIYRYQKRFEDLTGVRHEAWHFRYVGKKASKIMDSENMPFEEYYVKYLDK